MPIEKQRPQKSPSFRQHSSRHSQHRRIRPYCLSLIALAPATISRSAFAETVTVQISGTLSSGIDYLGLFGPAGTNLTNQIFITSFTYDTDDFKAGGESCNNSYITNTPGAITTSLTINGHTLSYPNTNNSSSCSNGDPFGATLGFVSGANTISNSAPYGKLYQSFFLSYSTSQLGTLDNPGSAGQGAFLIFSIDQGNDTSSDNFEGTAGPTIIFNEKPASTLPNPIPVVVGQQINLTANPAAKGDQSPSWNPAGSPIGTYNLTPNTAPPCAEITDPTPGCAEVSPPITNQPSTSFYWTTPGTYTVNYQYQPSQGAVENATAQFLVAAPTNVIVTPALGTITTFDNMSGIVPKLGKSWYLVCGSYVTGMNCISFDASASIPKYNGSDKAKFQWVQYVSQAETTILENSGKQKLCSDGPGLDNTYPYKVDSKPPPPDNVTFDSPNYQLMPNEQLVIDYFAATMYLEWDPKLPKSIPVALGSMSWSWSGGASQNDDGSWSVVSPTGPSANAFQSSSAYPTWTAVAVNRHQTCKPD